MQPNFSSSSHTHMHTHIYTCLFQEDTIIDLVSASVPYLKLINADCIMGGHREVSNPSSSSFAFFSSFQTLNMINLRIYFGTPEPRVQLCC